MNLPGGNNKGKHNNQTGEYGQYINPLTAKVLNLNAILAYATILYFGVQAYNIPAEELYLKFMPSVGAFIFGTTLMLIVQLLFIRMASGNHS